VAFGRGNRRNSATGSPLERLRGKGAALTR
jgi:hypothetical protein